MGYINNQWLLGNALRNRNHQPISATFRPETPTHKWDHEHGVVLELRVTRSDGDYQYVLFTEDDLRNFLNHAMGGGPPARDALVKAFSTLSDTELLDLVETVRSARIDR